MMLAAVDLGSNSFRLEIAKTSLGRLVTCRYQKETVRLAAGINSDGCIDEVWQEKALAALQKFRRLLGSLPEDYVLAVGTQVFREAKNGDAFLAKCSEALGHQIHLLSGMEEARLVYKGCSHALPPSDANRLVVDIGGGSTELIIGCGHEALDMESCRLGCVNTSLAFFQDGHLTLERFNDAVAHARECVTPLANRFGKPRFDEAYGSAGTFGAIAEVIATFDWSEDHGVSYADLEAIRDRLIPMGHVSNIRFAALKDDRREVFAGGLAALMAIYQVFGIERMYPAIGALRLGLLYELLDRHQPGVSIEACTGY